ncbi:hypothetical protein J6590_094472 [Homalodisca vitripennis]|nr:hypothetical protein J6590_094472 [Homalodisca vitripennis]
MVAEHLPFIQRQQPDRNRRSLTFVGDFFEWCCDIATEHQIHDLADNKEDVYTAFLNTTTLPTLRATCAFTCFVHNLQRQHHFQLKHDDKNIKVAGKEVLYYNSIQTSSRCNWIRTSAQTPMVNKQEMLA